MQTAADIPEAIDLGENPAEAVSRLIGQGAYDPRELGRDISAALIEPGSLAEILHALQQQEEHRQLENRLLLESVRAAQTEEATAAAEWAANGSQSRIAPESAAQLPAADQGERLRRQQQRILCRQTCRKGDIEDLLQQIEEAPHTAGTAADILIREDRIVDLIAHTIRPSEPLATAMARRNMSRQQNSPAPLRGHPATLIAARITQAADSGHGTRWLHRIHPALWVVGHRTDPYENTQPESEEAEPESYLLLEELPASWLAVAARASTQSQVNTQQMIRQNVPGNSGRIAAGLLPNWNGGLHELIRTAEKMTM